MEARQQFNISVISPASTVIGQIAQRLAQESPSAPKWSGPEIAVATFKDRVGHWGEDPSAYQRNVFYAWNGVNEQYTLQDWTGKTIWDPVHGDWYYLAGTTGWGAISQTLVRYRPSTDRFHHWQGGPADPTTPPVHGLFAPLGEAHNFDLTDFDPVTRSVFRHLTPNHRPDQQWVSALGLLNIDTKQTALFYDTSLPGDGYPGMCFHQTMGSGGTLLLMLGPRMQRYTFTGWNPTPVMTQLSDIETPDGCGAGCSHYLDGHALWTSGLDDRRFWALGADGIVRPRADTPVRMDDGGAWPTHTTFAVLSNRLYAFVNGTVYRFTPGPNPTDLGSWEDLNSPWPVGFIGNARMVVGALPAYGVVMAIPAGEEAGPFVWKP